MRTLMLTVLLLTVGVPAFGANLRGTIYALSTGGPFAYLFEVDGALKYNVNGIANAGAAFDSVKARIANEGGTVSAARFVVSKGTEKIVADLKPTATNGPFAYTFSVDGVWETVVNNVANLGAGADAIKTLVANEPGSFIKGIVTVGTQ